MIYLSSKVFYALPSFKMSAVCNIVIFCLCIIGCTYAKTEDEIKAWFLQLGMDCAQDHPISTNEALMLQKHKMPDTEEAKCLMACVYKKSGWMDDKGNYDVAAAHALVNDNKDGDDTGRAENAIKLFDTCKTVNEQSVSDGEKGCERAALLFLCLTENAPKVGFSIKNFL